MSALRPRVLLSAVPAILWALVGGCGSSSTNPPPGTGDPVRLQVSPDSAVVAPGNQFAFHAQALDASGRVVVAAVHWAVGDTAVATVDSEGVVTGVRPGRTSVDIRTSKLHAAASIRVALGGPTVAVVRLTPAAATFLAGDTQPFVAEPRDANGAFLAVPVTWSVEDPAVASVDTLGQVHCVAAGTTRVRADAGGVRGSTPLTVLAAPQVSNAAGTGIPGDQDGSAATATFHTPTGLAVDSLGAVYIADTGNHRIRVLESGQVRTLAGSKPGYADGAGTVAQFQSPTGVAVGPGRRVYVADRGNHVIRRIDPDGRVSTVAGQATIPGYQDSVAAEALFSGPSGVAVDGLGRIFVADHDNSVIREITPSGVVRLAAGTPGVPGFQDGGKRTGQMDEPLALTFGPDGALYSVERGTSSSAVRRVTIADGSGSLTTLAGNGVPGPSSGPRPYGQFDQPSALAVAADGWVYVADTGNRRVRAASPTGFVAQVAGSGASGDAEGPGQLSTWRYPAGVVVLAGGGLLVSDALSHRLRMVQGTLHASVPVWPRETLRLLPRPRLSGAHGGASHRVRSERGREPWSR